MPLHPKGKEFAKSGLFAGVKSFADLEMRIAAITENKAKGDAFEVFAEAIRDRHNSESIIGQF